MTENQLGHLELKSIEALEGVHAKQVLTQLRLTNLGLGCLINFGEEDLKDGTKETGKSAERNCLIEPLWQRAPEPLTVALCFPLRPLRPLREAHLAFVAVGHLSL